MQATDRTPVAGLRALLESSLDYAGLFPPASLQLEPAAKNYAKYRFGPDAWFLSHFVCPVSRLAELDDYIPMFAKSAPLLLSALALPSPGWREFTTRLRESLDLIFRFQHSHPERLHVDSIEIPLPADLTDFVGSIEVRDLIPVAAEDVELSGIAELTPFFEVAAADWDSQAPSTIDTIARHNQNWKGVHCQPAAFKLRTGGVKADAVPTIKQVVSVIRTCLDARVRFKCTAGLHHPVRHSDPSLGADVHGFLNIFGATALVHARALSRNDLPLILGDEDPAHFGFDQNGLTWNGVRATVEQISEARRDLIVSFGSCSFDEPLEDLQKLSML